MSGFTFGRRAEQRLDVVLRQRNDVRQPIARVDDFLELILRRDEEDVALRQIEQLDAGLGILCRRSV